VNGVGGIRRGRTATWAAYLGFALLFAWVLTRNREALAGLAAEDALQFVWLLALGLPMLGGRGLLNRMTFRPFGAELGLGAGTRLAVLQTLGNYLPLSAGLMAKAVVLKNRFRVPYTTSAVVSIYTYAAAVAASGAVGLLVLWRVAPHRPLLATGFSVMAAAVLVPLLPVGPLLTRVVPGATDWRSVRRRFRGVLGGVLVLHGALLALAALRLALAFQVFDRRIGYAEALLLSSGMILSRLANLTPGALGVREGLVAALGLVTGIDPGLSVLAVGVDRLAEVFVIFGSGALLSTGDRGPPTLDRALDRAPDRAPDREARR
jgi:uncharacterized membrane protein YbhN (UPF0104 family)